MAEQTLEESGQRLVARYDFRETAPRVGKDKVRLFPDLDLTNRYGRHKQGIVVTVEDEVFFPKLVQRLEAVGVPLEPVTDQWGELDPAFKDELKELAEPLGVRVHKLTSCDFSIETPTEEGQSVHIQKRKVLERFLRERDIDYEVECLTLHSDRACQLALED